MDQPAGPLALFFACLVSGLLVPVPEDVALLLAGWQVREGGLPLTHALAAGAAGTFARDALAFGLGRLVVRGAASWAPLRHLLAHPTVLWARARLESRGDLLLFLTRFAIGVRAPLYFAGGTTGRSFARFAAFDALGLLITTPLLIWLGYAFGPGTADHVHAALRHQRLALVVTVAAVVGWWAWRWSRRRARRRGQSL